VDLRPGDAGRGAAAMDEGILRVLIVSLGMALVAIVVLGIGSLIRRDKEPGMGVELAFITLIGILVFLWLDRGVGPIFVFW
jgi:hypothetical protein